MIGMAFVAGFLSRKSDRTTRKLTQSVGPIPPKPAKRSRGEERPRNQVSPNNDAGQKHQPENLGRHFIRAHTFKASLASAKAARLLTACTSEFLIRTVSGC